MACQKPPQDPRSALLSNPGCKWGPAPSEDDSSSLGVLLSGAKMVLSIVLFVGICVFTAYVALLCAALFFAALQVLFSTLIPSVLLIFQFLLSALLLFSCMQWMSEILALQFRFHEPVV